MPNNCHFETRSTYDLVIRSMLEYVDTLVSDASRAIRNAFLIVFGAGMLIIMCWAHVRRIEMERWHLH